MSGILSSFFGGIVSVAKDTYFNLVTLLLPGNGTNGAQNNTFLDSSTNNFTITRNGNTTQGTFSPFSQTGWSNFFDGTDDYLSIADNAVLRPGTSNFTLEAWIWRGASGAAHTIYAKGGASTGIVFQVTSTNVLRFTHTTTNIDSTGTISANAWTHVAVVREGTGTNQTKLYINGTQDGQGTVSTDFTQTEEVRIGTNRGATDDFNGYISNLRFVKGTALYTGTFTPSTTPLTTTSQGATATEVELLTCQSNRFVDNSSNDFSITVNNNVSVQAFSPFAPTAAYSASTVGGSGYFDGTGDSLSAPSSSSAFNFSGDYTVEFWFNLTSRVSDSYFIRIFDSGNSANGYSPFVFYLASGPSLRLYSSSDGASWNIQNNAAVISTIVANQWYHVALTRSGSGTNNTKVFVNGSQALQYTDTTSFTRQNGFGVNTSAQTGTSGGFQGYVSGLRVLNGTGYTSVSVPTAPPTAITNTTLLLNYTNAGITDATAKNDLETVGNAQISTTQSKWGGASIAFDGTGDRLYRSDVTPNFGFGTGDYTVEFWLYVTSFPGSKYTLIDFRAVNGATPHTIYISNTGYMGFYNGSSDVTSSSQPVSTGSWFHIAYARSSGTLRIFVNGNQAYSASNTIDYLATRAITIGDGIGGQTGECLIGYMDDVRVTKGYARYTANFTAPSSAFELQ